MTPNYTLDDLVEMFSDVQGRWSAARDEYQRLTDERRVIVAAAARAAAERPVEPGVKRVHAYRVVSALTGLSLTSVGHCAREEAFSIEYERSHGGPSPYRGEARRSEIRRRYGFTV